MADAGPVVADLRAESAELDSMVAELSDQQWRTATPAPGWTIAHQIAHLWWTDRVALQSATDRAAFDAVLAEAAQDPFGFVDAAAEQLADTPPATTSAITDASSPKAPPEISGSPTSRASTSPSTSPPRSI